MKYKNLTVIGTSHIAKQSLDEVKRAIEEEKPDIIALELDRKRLYALTHDNKGGISIYSIRRVGLKGFIFSLIGAWAERKLGKMVGVSPGSEMKNAINLAKKGRMEIALVDQDIEITLKRFSQTLTWKERWNFIVDIAGAIILRKKELEFDLKTVPSKEIIDKLVRKVKERYPNVYNVLIEERNKVMGRNLRKLMDKHPNKKILAIVGAGHKEEIIKAVKRMESISYSFSIG